MVDSLFHAPLSSPRRSNRWENVGAKPSRRQIIIDAIVHETHAVRRNTRRHHFARYLARRRRNYAEYREYFMPPITSPSTIASMPVGVKVEAGKPGAKRLEAASTSRAQAA